MEKTIKIFVAVHRGLVGSATARNLELKGYVNIFKRTHTEVDLKGEVAFDGTPRKLLDVSLLRANGWRAVTNLEGGLRIAYKEFKRQADRVDHSRISCHRR